MNQNIYIRRLCIGGCLVLLFTLNSLFTYSQVSIKNDTLSGHQKLAHDIFKELIEINTTSRYGITKAAEAMASRQPARPQ